jgi:hypothetical protein
MYKRLLFLAALALPGSFLIVAACTLHPRGRAFLAEIAGLRPSRSDAWIAARKIACSLEVNDVLPDSRRTRRQ